jgi:hypothetical protein
MMADYLADSWNRSRAVIEEYWPHQILMPYCRFYLYYRQTSPTGEAGAVKVIRDGDAIPDGFILATPEALPRDRAKDAVAAWLQPIIYRLPILGRN